MTDDIKRDIHALPAKLRVMAEVLHEKRSIKRPSLKELAAHVKINYNTLKSSRSDGRLSKAIELKLAGCFSFDSEDSAWIDTRVDARRRSLAEGHDYPGRDTVANFRYMLRALHSLPTDQFVRLESQRPELLDSNLAVLDMSDSGQHTVSNEALELFFSIILEPGYHESGLSFGFCRARLRFLFREGSQAKLNRRLGDKDEIEIANAKLSARGGVHGPEWFLAIPDAVLQGEYVNSGAALCQLSGCQVGELFHAELSVRLMDGSLRSSCGGELPYDTKRIIIEQLFAERLRENSDTQGWLTFGRQALRIVRADQL